MSRLAFIALIATCGMLFALPGHSVAARSVSSTAHSSWQDAWRPSKICSPSGVSSEQDHRALRAVQGDHERQNSTGMSVTGQPPPSFECLYVASAYWSSTPRHEWCGPLGTARVSWRIVGGTDPMQVTIDDASAPAQLGYLDIPCESIWDRYVVSDSPHVQIVALQATVRDADGRHAHGSVEVGFVSSTPAQRIDQIKVLPGVQDANFVPLPWPFLGGDDLRPHPLGMAAIVRYRALGATAWSYVTPLPAPAQSGCGLYCVPSHAGDLEPDTQYELQAAWMWNQVYSDSWDSGDRWRWWQDEALRDSWWRSWVEPDELTWSETVRFRTFGELRLQAETTHDTVRVSWLASAGHFHASAYSPDWPGVVWFDRDNSYQWHRDREAAQTGRMSAVIAGLPADTPFVVVVRQLLPPSFHRLPPATVELRTQTGSANAVPRWADPGDIDVSLSGGVVTVEWSKGWPTFYTRVGLFRLPDDGCPAIRGPWILAPRPSELDPFDEQISRRVSVRLPLGERPEGSTWTLVVNRSPGHMGRRSDAFPYICMLWQIRVPPIATDGYLDRFFFSAEQAGTMAVQPAQMLSEGNWPSKCVAGEPTSE
ncbi:MAG: hypothetical protein F4Z38_12220 [Chloroflexi bacterium]|nr:hypothetical protein [Chloroflexota bacterium]